MSSILLLLMLAASDPRIRLVELQMAGETELALAETERLIQEQPIEAGRLGLSYLKGHLLDQLGRRAEAAESFAATISSTPKLSDYALLRIAQDQELLGHPEVTAGIAATVLGSGPSRSIVGPAAELLVRAIEMGGECRLLRNLLTRRFPTAQRRSIQLAQANCDLRSKDLQAARERLTSLIREKRSDLTALLAANLLSTFDGITSQPSLVRLLGFTFHHHRQFERSSNLLERVVVQLQPQVRGDRDYEVRYRLVRSHFWLGRYELAAQRYADLASRALVPKQVSQALYQRGRSLELAGQWPTAVNSFQRTYVQEREGRFAGAGLLGAMRLEWRRGREEAALELYEVLGESPLLRPERGRAALFLAVSDIVRGRTDRASRWLNEARAAASTNTLETTYWRGRLAEALGEPRTAIDSYLRALRRDYFHPMAQLALARLASTQLRATLSEVQQAAAGEQDFDSWVLLGLEPKYSEERALVTQSLLKGIERDNRGRPLLAGYPAAIDSWSLWASPLFQPEELLLALGVWSEATPVVMRHFPVSNAALALTAAHQLERAGRTKNSLLIAEILERRLPKKVPPPLLPREFRTALYPYSYRYLIERSAERYRVSPFLLAALIREESKFDPRASSAAAARGLTQFVITTAERIAREHGMGPISPRELEKPEVAIELGAAYLRELLDRYQGAWPQAIAAYNAGEPQAHLWQRYCYSVDPAEFLTKVAFRETRLYIGKVFRSFAQYRDLYSKPIQSADPTAG